MMFTQKEKLCIWIPVWMVQSMGSSVGSSVILCPKRLWVWSPVRAHAGGTQSISLSPPPTPTSSLSLKLMNMTQVRIKRKKCIRRSPWVFSCSCQRFPDLRKHGQMDRQLANNPCPRCFLLLWETFKSLSFIHFFPTTSFSPVHRLAFHYSHSREASASEIVLWSTSVLCSFRSGHPHRFVFTSLHFSWKLCWFLHSIHHTHTNWSPFYFL